ncbi:MAG: beta-ketoacyl-[acyl-carrier-protein] synthase [Rubritepida sp.]|nr:beta-ketoacyl-[acyl-carrier-protein] synthase [Rubritepida sp.]
MGADAMWPLAITASSAVSALGTGVAPLRAALHARRGGLVRTDFPGGPAGTWLGQVAGLDIAPPPELAGYDCRNNRLAEMALRSDGFEAAVIQARERHGADRVAVILGTSTAGIGATERAYAQREPGQTALTADFDYAHTHDLQALPNYLRVRLGLRGPALAVSTACTSGARAIMQAAVLIAAGVVDAAVAGGVDTLCRLTLNGFGSLGLLGLGPCRPCASDRDGVSIGEAAGLLLLERPGSDGATLLLGAGASSDGHHMSSPHPDGLGAVGAMRAALAAAGLRPDAIDYVNLHGTGTRANDAMEDRAVHHLFGDGVPCSSTKGWTGHTLGASGALEAIIAAICLEDGLVPGCLGVDVADPEFRSRVATGNLAAPLQRVMSNSFGFGGSNCSLILGRAA